MARRNQSRPHAEQLCLVTERIPPRAWLAFTGLELLVSSDLTLRAWQEPVIDALRVRHTTESTRTMVVGDARRLFRVAEAFGAEEWHDLTAEIVSHYVWAARPDKLGRFRPVAKNTARNRQWSALACLQEAEELGAPIDPMALIGDRIAPPPASVSVRPLDEEEEYLAKRRADTGIIGSRRSLLFVSSYCGGSARAVASMRARDIDLAAMTLTFRADAPRTNALDDWSAEIVYRWWKCLPEEPHPDELVCVKPGATVASGAKSVGVRLGNILTEAGIRHRPGVSAGSIRLTGARHVFEQHGIEAAARFLGAVSLDRTAEALRHHWREDGDA